MTEAATPGAGGREPRPGSPAVARLRTLALAALLLAASAGVLGAAAGEHGSAFWRAIAALVIGLVAAGALLAGLELAARRLLTPLGPLLGAFAPVAAATLLVANWRDHVGLAYKHVLISCATLLLSGLAVAGLRLLAGARRSAPWILFAIAAVAAAALDALALAMTWSDRTPDAGLTALFGLILLVLLLGAAIRVLRAVQRR